MLLPRACWIPQGKGCLCVGPARCLCPSPSEALQLLLPVFLSHLGPVPLGKSPAPVHLSLQSWSSCFFQQQQQPGKKDSVSLCPALPKPHLSAAPGHPGLGALCPERGGAPGRCSFAGVSSLLCAGCDSNQLFFRSSGKKKRNSMCITRFYFQGVLSVPRCICLRCSCILAKQRSKG